MQYFSKFYDNPNVKIISDNQIYFYEGDEEKNFDLYYDDKTNTVRLNFSCMFEYKSSLDTNDVLELHKENINIYLYKGWVTFTKKFTIDELESLSINELDNLVARLYNKF